MKLPRWLVISMLTSSVLAVPAAAGWWWVTWPERSARDFVDLMGEERDQRLSRVMTPELAKLFVDETAGLSTEEAAERLSLTREQIDGRIAMRNERRQRPFWRQQNLQSVPRSNSDGFRARQTFTLAETAWFTVQRGTVIDFGILDTGRFINYADFHATR